MAHNTCQLGFYAIRWQQYCKISSQTTTSIADISLGQPHVLFTLCITGTYVSVAHLRCFCSGRSNCLWPPHTWSAPLWADLSMTSGTPPPGQQKTRTTRIKSKLNNGLEYIYRNACNWQLWTTPPPPQSTNVRTGLGRREDESPHIIT